LPWKLWSCFAANKKAKRERQVCTQRYTLHLNSVTTMETTLTTTHSIVRRGTSNHRDEGNRDCIVLEVSKLSSLTKCGDVLEISSIDFGDGGVWCCLFYLTFTGLMFHRGFSCGPCIFQQPLRGIAAWYYVILRHLCSSELPWMPWSVNTEGKWQTYVCLFTLYTAVVGLTLKPCILSMSYNYKYVFLVILKIKSYSFPVQHSLIGINRWALRSLWGTNWFIIYN
jgi:hypothetical protein